MVLEPTPQTPTTTCDAARHVIGGGCDDGRSGGRSVLHSLQKMGRYQEVDQACGSDRAVGGLDSLVSEVSEREVHPLLRLRCHHATTPPRHHATSPPRPGYAATTPPRHHHAHATAPPRHCFVPHPPLATSARLAPSDIEAAINESEERPVIDGAERRVVWSVRGEG